MMYVTLVLLIFAFAIYQYMTSTFSYWSDRGIPFVPNPVFLYGSMKEVVTFKVGTTKFIDQIYHRSKQRGEKFIGFFLSRMPTLLLIDPVLIKNALVKNFTAFHDRTTVYDEKFDPLSAHLVNIHGQKWKFLKAKLSPVFTPGKMRTLIGSVNEATERLLNLFQSAVNKNESVDIREIMAQYATDVIGSTAFGLDLQTSGNSQSKFRKMGRSVLEPSRLERTKQRLIAIFPWLYRVLRLRRFNEETTDFFVKLFKDTVEYRKKNKITRHDFLQILMTLKDSKVTDDEELEEMQGIDNYNTKVQQNAVELSDGVLTAQLFIFFLAGYETTSTTMSFALHELALNPDLQDRAVQDITQALDKYGGVTYEAIHSMKYLDKVINETLRKYPPLPVVRRCTEKFKLPDTDASIDPGVFVIVPVYSLHHDREYFPDPEIFDPDRFSNESKANFKPGTYLPFGDGPRTCIAARFAMLEMKIGFAHLLPKYRVEPCSKTTKMIEFEAKTIVLTPKNSIWLDVKPR